MRSSDTRLLALAGLLFVAVAASSCGGKPKYPSCDGDRDCKAGEKCVNKQCRQCSADSECAPGHTCEEGGCTPIPGWCSADGDCAQGQVCKGNKCVACEADSECGEGGRCRNGKCLRKGQCELDEDCAEDEDCVAGVCVKGGASSGDLPKCALLQIYFGFDQSTVAEEAKGSLKKNAECLSSTPRKVAIVGHTDPRGTDEYNIALSDQRARVVMDYLARLGISTARMRVVPKGESEASGTDDTGWSRDRRVEFTWD